MSNKVDEIKNKKRNEPLTPAGVIIKDAREERNAGKIERKRVSFDIRVDLHKELKMQSLLQEKNIYILIEEAIDEYLKK